MKKLILLSLISLKALAQNELSEQTLKNTFVAKVKEVEIVGQISKTAQFQKCKEGVKFDPKVPIDDQLKKVEDAQKCFKQELTNNKDPEALKKLSDNLGLQSYGLVKSRNVQDITDYLSNKLYKAITGIDKEETDQRKIMEQMKFKNMKMVDQSVFIDLYKTQLSKVAMFEISRYCFEDLRKTTSSEEVFSKHWASELGSGNFPGKGGVTDDGKIKFKITIDPKDVTQTYKSVLESVGTDQLTPEHMSKFWGFCSGMIAELCKEYESQFTPNSPAPTTPDSRGSKSCLVKARVQEMRKALEKTDLVIKQMADNSASDKKTNVLLELDKKNKWNLFDPGATEDTSIDNLTNISSNDVFQGGRDASTDKMEEECALTPEIAKCEGFLNDTKATEKAQLGLATDLALKNEVELARIRELKKNKVGLMKYLTDNGYLDLKEGLEKSQMSEDEIEAALDKAFAAKRVAAIEEFKSKVGTRQLKGDAPSDQDKTDKIKENAKDAQSERARLAQVILFNNIITSHLELQKEVGNNQYETVGRNVNAWNVEEKGLVASKVNPNLFSNLSQSAKDAKTPSTKDTSMVGLGMLNTILGAPDDDGKNSQAPAPNH